MTEAKTSPTDRLVVRSIRMLSNMGFWLTTDFEVGSQSRKLQKKATVDMLGVRFDRMFTPTKIVADCAELEMLADSDSILRLSGLRDYFSADDAYFVRPKVHHRTKLLASKLNIRVLDDESMRLLERSSSTSSFGEDFAQSYLNERVQTKYISDRPELSQLERYLSFGFWSVDFYRNLLILVEMYSDRKHLFEIVDEKTADLAFRGAERFSLCLLEMGRYILTQDLKELTSRTRSYLHGGHLSLRDKERFFGLLRQLTGSDEKLDPTWFNDYLELVARMVFHSNGAHDVIRYLSLFKFLDRKKRQIGQNDAKTNKEELGVSKFASRDTFITEPGSKLIIPGYKQKKIALLRSNGDPIRSTNNHEEIQKSSKITSKQFENIEAVILAKDAITIFTRITGINPNLFASVHSY